MVHLPKTLRLRCKITSSFFGKVIMQLIKHRENLVYIVLINIEKLLVMSIFAIA